MPKLQGAIFDVDGHLIQAGDFTAYPDALRFVIATKDAGMLIADASSSKNAALFLRQIRLDTFAQEHGIFSPTLRPGLTLLADRPVCLPGEAILKACVAELVDRLDDAQHVALAGIFEEPHEP